MEKYVIIGGVAGGATTAARLRRLDEEAQIIIFERGNDISYANCGLPYYIGGEIQEREALLLQTPEAMNQKYRIDVRIQSEVTRINPAQKTVEVWNHGENQKYQESYDKLVIATGSSPLKPGIPGIDGENIFPLWTIPDTDVIKKFLKNKRPERAAIIGGGFIGLEMAENLHRQGVEVTIIEMQNQVMAPVDPEMAQLLHENMRMNHVELVLGDGVTSFENRAGEKLIRLSSGRTVSADMVILSIGVRPNSELAREAGLQLNQRGGIQVNEYLETPDLNIYAVGDVIEVMNYVTKEPTMIPLAGPANKQGRICADNLRGARKKYRGTMGTSVARVFDLTVAAVGLNEKSLKAAGKTEGQDYQSILINQKSHAGYYPGATLMTLKLLFQMDGKILGAQIVGQDGVDKRIDTIATVLKCHGTVENLAELELAYAPPFSSAKDPVNMLGFTAQNVLEGKVDFITAEELDRWSLEGREDYVILDIREDIERMAYSIQGSYHIPFGKVRERIQELEKEKCIIVYCAIGVRSYNVARILSQQGFQRVRVLAGGTSFYRTMHHMDGQPDRTQSDRERTREHTDQNQNQGKGNTEVRNLNCSGLQCPGPIMKVSQALKEMEPEQELRVSATDMGFARDVESWCRRTGNTFLHSERVGSENIVHLKKGAQDGGTSAIGQNRADGKTMVVFSGDLDKVLASFIIANGAAAMGRPVTMFFTFWGLNALRRPEKMHVKKTAVERMFGRMMPQGTDRLKLSKMNMGGMGTSMMKRVMERKNVSSLEELMAQARANGVRLVACTMSMDIMGITKEELVDGVELAGVASYLGDAEESNVNLFI